MIFNYKAITNTGEQTEGTVEAFNVDLAINQLQKKVSLYLRYAKFKKNHSIFQ